MLMLVAIVCWYDVVASKVDSVSSRDLKKSALILANCKVEWLLVVLQYAVSKILTSKICEIICLPLMDPMCKELVPPSRAFRPRPHRRFLHLYLLLLLYPSALLIWLQ